MSAFRHITLLLWKNAILQIRHPWVTAFEILIPCFFVAMLASIRTAVKVTHYEKSTDFPSFDIYHVPNITFPNRTIYKILYAPNSSFTQDIVNQVQTKLTQLSQEDKFDQRFNFLGKFSFKITIRIN